MRKNLRESVKSVGLKESMRKNLRHLRNLRDKLIFSEKKNQRRRKRSAGRKTRKPQKSFEI